MFDFNYDISIYLKRDFIMRFNKNKNIGLIKNITINTSYKKIIDNKKNLGFVLSGIKLITRHYPLPTYAKNSIATFKLRKYMTLGCKLALSHEWSLYFLYILKTSILPTINDVKIYLKKNFDINNNYSIGLNDITLYPEINYSFEFFNKSIGMNLNFKLYKENYYDIKNINKFIISELELPIFNKYKNYE